MPLDASLRTIFFRELSFLPKGYLVNFHLPIITGRGTHYGNILKNTLESARPHSDCGSTPIYISSGAGW